MQDQENTIITKSSVRLFISKNRVEFGVALSLTTAVTFSVIIFFRNVNNVFLKFQYDPWNHSKSIQIYRDIVFVCRA